MGNAAARSRSDGPAGSGSIRSIKRPCFFPREQVDAKGRVRKRYRHAEVMTPCEKLQSLPDAAACLKPGTTFDQLDALATARSDNEAARALSQARERLFRSLDPAA